MARIDGLGGEIEEKIGKLSAELNDLDVKITTNVTALDSRKNESSVPAFETVRLIKLSRGS